MAQQGLGATTGSSTPRRPSSSNSRWPRACLSADDLNGKAEIPIVLDDSVKDAKLIDAASQWSEHGEESSNQVCRWQAGRCAGRRDRTRSCALSPTSKSGAGTNTTVGPVYVGDLWVLAGQSNMEGVGNLIELTPPHPKVMLLGMDGNWGQAEEPLHWLIDSPDPVLSGDPKTRRQSIRPGAQVSNQGNRPWLAGFAVGDGRVDRRSDRPGGLRSRRHEHGAMEPFQERGGGSQALWLDAPPGQASAGGKVKGVLWYQGESDAPMPDAWKVYPKVFSDFIAAVRADFGQPELPFYYASRSTAGSSAAAIPRNWNARAGRPAGDPRAAWLTRR